jgi:hypothetical protein
MDRHGGAKPARGRPYKQHASLHASPRTPSNAPGPVRLPLLCSVPLLPFAAQARWAAHRKGERGWSTAGEQQRTSGGYTRRTHTSISLRGPLRSRGGPTDPPRQTPNKTISNRSTRPRGVSAVLPGIPFSGAVGLLFFLRLCARSLRPAQLGSAAGPSEKEERGGERQKTHKHTRIRHTGMGKGTHGDG